MSDAEIEKITDSAGTGAPNFTYGLNSGGSDSGLLGFAYTASGTAPSSPANGDVWFDTANDKYYTYINGEFKQITHSNAVNFTWGGTRAVAMGGYASSGISNVMQYWDMSSASNATDFGDLQQAKYQATGLSNASRGIAARGFTGSAKVNEIDYITISTTGNATDFGDAIAASSQNGGNGACDGTTGLFAGGDDVGTYSATIDAITVATTGNSTDHGDLTAGRIYVPMANDATRYLAFGGYESGGANWVNKIEYGSFTAGNAVDFGDLINSAYNAAALSDTTRALKAGGYGGSNTNVIEYVTIQTTGNGTDFGDLSSGRQGVGGFSDGTNGHFAGGWSYELQIDAVVIQTTGNATDHGDLAVGYARPACCSGNAS